MNLGAAIVDPLIVSSSSDPLNAGEVGHQTGTGDGNTPADLGLLAAHGQTLATLGTAALEHQPTILCAHANEEAVCAHAATLVRLICTNALGHNDSLLETNRQC